MNKKLEIRSSKSQSCLSHFVHNMCYMSPTVWTSIYENNCVQQNMCDQGSNSRPPGSNTMSLLDEDEQALAVPPLVLVMTRSRASLLLRPGGYAITVSSIGGVHVEMSTYNRAIQSRTVI
jgi:hypothetical protein